MKRDKKILERFKNEEYNCPKDISVRIDETLEDLRASNDKKSFFNAGIAFRFAVVLCVSFFIIVPNVNMNMAYAMQEIPVIGEIVKVITVRQYETEDETHLQIVEIPEISDEGEAAGLVNADIKALTDAALLQFEKECKEVPEAHTGVIIDYDVVTNSKEWFTLKIMIQHEAGSGVINHKYYHIDKVTGKGVTLANLFKDDFNYVEVISENVSKQMRGRNARLGDEVYWIDNEDVPEWNFKEIKPDQNFYFDDEGQLTLVFDKYQVAPGYMGTPEFTIEKGIYINELE